MLNQLGERHGGSISSRGDKSLNNGLVELGSSSASQELVQLNQESDVGIISLGILSPRGTSSAATLKIDSHKKAD